MEAVVELELRDHEREALERSAEAVKELVDLL
jgi:malate/lactate dehydrogenase